jgi:dihydrofolate reductase
MKKIIFQIMISLDGYYEGPNGEINWHNVDEELNNHAINLLNNVDTLLFGRKTYDLMVNFWPTKLAAEADPVVAKLMNQHNKVVVSRTLEGVNWGNNTLLINHNVVEEIENLKVQNGKDIALFGSSNLATTLIGHGLIDEFRVIVCPVILGGGSILFNGLQEMTDLKLQKTTMLQSGKIILQYTPVKK